MDQRQISCPLEACYIIQGCCSTLCMHHSAHKLHSPVSCACRRAFSTSCTSRSSRSCCRLDCCSSSWRCRLPERSSNACRPSPQHLREPFLVLISAGVMRAVQLGNPSAMACPVAIYCDKCIHAVLCVGRWAAS